jgi:hypothetical protein
MRKENIIMENRTFTGNNATCFAMGIQYCCMSCFAIMKHRGSDG